MTVRAINESNSDEREAAFRLSKKLGLKFEDVLFFGGFKPLVFGTIGQLLTTAGHVYVCVHGVPIEEVVPTEASKP